ncbi:hypothetical protein ACL9RF_04485 [Sphingobacterium sp. Mn56C]|uniref:hypothetical protein n=1 Tax=Sphingobacterium sp. Mn56C TaxID=3395261 RepID=UPI003BD35EC5
MLNRKNYLSELLSFSYLGMDRLVLLGFGFLFLHSPFYQAMSFSCRLISDNLSFRIPQTF